MSRTGERESFPEPVRLRLLEGDADELDSKFDAHTASTAAEIAGVRSEMAALRQVLTGILVALVVASIMLSLNLVVHK